MLSQPGKIQHRINSVAALPLSYIQSAILPMQQTISRHPTPYGDAKLLVDLPPKNHWNFFVVFVTSAVPLGVKLE